MSAALYRGASSRSALSMQPAPLRSPTPRRVKTTPPEFRNRNMILDVSMHLGQTKPPRQLGFRCCVFVSRFKLDKPMS